MTLLCECCAGRVQSEKAGPGTDRVHSSYFCSGDKKKSPILFPTGNTRSNSVARQSATCPRAYKLRRRESDFFALFAPFLRAALNIPELERARILGEEKKKLRQTEQM